jgi:hypothetical protein
MYMIHIIIYQYITDMHVIYTYKDQEVEAYKNRLLF